MLKRLFVAVVTSVVLTSAQGVTIADVLRSPIGTGITVARWIYEASASEKVLYVEVISEGNTFEQAKQQGFRLAVEHAVGTVVASETEVRNDRVARDEIITYASGYVDRFEVVEQQRVGNRVLVNMKVWVRPSKIANRLLNKSATAGTVEGGRISAQIQTLQHERTSGDRLLKSVLADYPKRAFVIEMDKTQVMFDANRTGQLEVAFWLSWSKEYLESIAEALSAINQRSDCGGLFGCRNVASQIDVIRPGFGSTTQTWFNDKVADQMVRKEMIQSQPTIRIAIVDTTGKEQFKQCFYAKELDYRDHSAWYYVNQDHDRVAINGKAVKRFNTFIDLSRLPTANLDQVKIAMVRGPNC
jgi:hypothetical protein